MDWPGRPVLTNGKRPKSMLLFMHLPIWYISGLSCDAADADDKKDDIPIHRTKGHLYHALFKKAKYQFDCYHREMQYIVKCGSDLYKGTFVGYQISNTLLVWRAFKTVEQVEKLMLMLSLTVPNPTNDKC